MAIDSMAGGLDTARLSESEADRLKRTERDRDAVVILGSRGLWDILEILGLRHAALAEVTTRLARLLPEDLEGQAAKLARLMLAVPEPEPEPTPPPKPEPKPKQVVAIGECQSCYRTYEKAACNQRFCSERCQKRAKRARERQAT